MSYSTQNLGSLMDDLGSEESAGGGKAKHRTGSGGQPFWKSQGFAITLTIVAVVVLAGGTWYSFFSGGPPKPPSVMTLIDLHTGELYSVKLGSRAYFIPMKNPATGSRSLYPVSKDDNENWVISERFQDALGGEDVDKSVIGDMSNGVVVPIDEVVTKIK